MQLLRVSLPVLTLSFTVLVQGQDLGVPLSWRKFSNSRPRDERVKIAQNAINALLPQLNQGTGLFSDMFWQSGNAWAVLANQDHLVGQPVNQQNVVTNLNKVFQLNRFDPFGYHDDAMWWACASVYAYRAYGDGGILRHAIDVWNRVSAFQITQAQANSGGNYPGKSFSIKGKCENKSMVGAVFWRPVANDQSLNSITTGLFLSLSAYLAEIYPDEAKYKNAAIAAATWIRDLQISSEKLVLDSVNAHDCKRSPDNWIFTYNSGKFIEGLSVLADVTKDRAWKDLLVNTIAAAVKTHHWQGDDGIITEGARTDKLDDGAIFKAAFVRGLLEAHQRNQDNRDLGILIHSYLDVQYNALLDLAATGNTYSPAWHGPPAPFTTWGQMAALDVLTANIVTN